MAPAAGLRVVAEVFAQVDPDLTMLPTTGPVPCPR